MEELFLEIFSQKGFYILFIKYQKGKYNNSFLTIMEELFSKKRGEHFWGIFSQKGILYFVYKMSKRKYIFLFDNYGRTFLEEMGRIFFGNILPKGDFRFIYKISKMKNIIIPF
jgi:hypothetical protein